MCQVARACGTVFFTVQGTTEIYTSLFVGSVGCVYETVREGSFFIACPDGSWPSHIAPVATHDVNMELIDDVADGGDVDFVDVKSVFDPD